MDLSAEVNFVVQYSGACSGCDARTLVALMHALPLIMASNPSQVFVLTVLSIGLDPMEAAYPGYRQVPAMALVATAVDALLQSGRAAEGVAEALHTMIAD